MSQIFSDMMRLFVAADVNKDGRRATQEHWRRARLLLHEAPSDTYGNAFRVGGPTDQVRRISDIAATCYTNNVQLPYLSNILSGFKALRRSRSAHLHRALPVRRDSNLY